MYRTLMWCFIARMLCLSVVTSLILTITHSVASSLPLGSRNVQFLHVAFDSAGERFIAGDCQGNVFLFDIRGNRYDKLITLFISISHMGVTVFMLYVSMVFAVALCPSLCPLCWCIVSTWLKILLNFFFDPVAPSFYLFDSQCQSQTSMGIRSVGA